MAVDRFGRNIGYLRISLTDRCNFRCVYCMPEDIRFQPSAEMMTDAELLALMRLFADLGFAKFRLTGGEPTLRPSVVEIVRQMRQTPGVGEISMTTNGMRLAELARPLAEAGLDRLNISVDSLNVIRFHEMTRRGQFEQVWAGILAAEAAGLLPIKLNMVVMQDTNRQDVADLASLTLDRPWHVRYIELMPFSPLAEMALTQIVPERELIGEIEAHLGPLTPLQDKLHSDAHLYRLPNALGTLGFISSVSAPFCASCNRLRLTADGKLRLCLLRDGEADLLSPLRQGASPDELKEIIAAAIWRKPWGHGLGSDIIPAARTMSQIGG